MEEDTLNKVVEKVVHRHLKKIREEMKIIMKHKMELQLNIIRSNLKTEMRQKCKLMMMVQNKNFFKYSNAKGKVINIPKFNGEFPITNPVELWIEMVTKAAEENSWSKEEIFYFAKKSLTGTAKKSFLRDNARGKYDSWSRMKKYLFRNFGCNEKLLETLRIMQNFNEIDEKEFNELLTELKDS